jgi:hypothetical protein
MLRESWTQYDPELVEREFLPQERRRELHRRVSAHSLENFEEQIERYTRRTRALNTIRR